MNKSKWLVTSVLGTLLSTAVFAQVTLEPELVEISDISQSKTMVVTHQGQPVSAAEIKKVVSGVFKYRDDVPATAKDGTHFSNYSHMFDFTINNDGSITIKAIEGQVQVGSYTVYVHTNHGIAKGMINASLSKLLPARPQSRVREPDFTYHVVLPDYSEGQMISIDLNPDNKNTYSWYINGELHSSGVGKTSFRARAEVGTQEISFVAKNPEGDVVSTWSDTTQVSK